MPVTDHPNPVQPRGTASVERPDSPGKPDLSAYKRWLQDKHNVCIDSKLASYYDTVATKMHRDFISSEFYTHFVDSVPAINGDYYSVTGYPLFINPDPSAVTIEIKPFNSVLLKTFRKNVLENELWPNPPNTGWVLPPDCFDKLRDILRTRLVVKYLDGMDFLVQALTTACDRYSLQSEISWQAKSEGYYACHFCLLHPFEIPLADWTTTTIIGAVELQITTQIQQVILTLLHKYYEDRRLGTGESKLAWQWDYRSDEFVPNYLGHILHYVEGMIMEIRSRRENPGETSSY